MMDGKLAVLFITMLCFVYDSHESMQWTLIDDTQAVCNDYSRAGFFLERTGSTKWVIFLESGGLCYSPETCNRRFIKPEVRLEFATNTDDPLYNLDPELDLNRTWNTLVSLNRSLSMRINPYMTSISTYIKDNQRLTQVEGRDMLSDSQQLNPMFHDFNRIVVPYCSSDLWLAEDTFVPVGVDLNSSDPQKQFLNTAYSPETEKLQFAFRGRTIIKAVFQQLLRNSVLTNATEILLAGSSAGGLGAVNIVQWMISELENNTITADVSVLVDSSWFIDFRGNIFRRFDGTQDSTAISRTEKRLFDLIESIPQCSTTTSTGTPCCVSLECILLDERYFPVGDVPVMVVFSLYDVFLLADAIANETPPGEETVSQTLPSLGISFLQTVAEYSGAMNSSIIDTMPRVPRLSYVATHCFQHVYFATSTLWDADSILRESSTEEISATLGQFTGSFRHIVQSGVWINYSFDSDTNTSNAIIDSCDQSKAHTMRDAINIWYRCRSNSSYEFRDNCYSVRCRNVCPEDIEFFTTNVSPYPSWSIVLIVCIVVTLTVVTIFGKLAFFIWKLVLFKRQDLYLERVEKDEEENMVDGIPKFPVCGLEDAISIACLDLNYSVKFRKKKAKDERRDSTTISFAIAHHIADEEEEEEKLLLRGGERRSTRSIHSVKSARNIEASRKHSTSYLGKIDEEDTVDGYKNSHPQPSTQNESSSLSNTNGMSGSSIHRQEACDKRDSRTSVQLSSLNDEPEMEEQIDFIEEDDQSTCVPCKGETKQILKGVSVYFNPGELVGIMGPSGCGKTTFLDLLTGRRTTGHIEGEIFVNGIPLHRVRDEYLSFTGYVLQLATPYYEELTVRENITLSAQIKLPRKMTWREKFERVEQVIDVTGLTNVSDLMVGGVSGPGLSGGQKKRLTIALQLLTMPKVIFLDEPTSGLDSTASIELLSHLNNLADSNRTVVLTIHQPRLEIFHMFHKLILLSDGKIAYHGVPQKAYGFFVEAAVNSFWNKKLTIPEIGDQNPADIIMDMLGKPILRRAILSHYQASTEPDLIKWAIRQAKVKDFESISIATLDTDDPTQSFRRTASVTPSPYQIQGSDFVKQDKASWFNRLAVLETRADKRSTLIWNIYLPVIFFGYGLLLGTTYLQQDNPLLIMSGFCVYSVASALFMFPVMQNYFIKALDVYRFENADGAGRASDIVIQAVARFSTLAIIPVVMCSAVLYLLLVNIKFWDIYVLLKLIVVGMALNQTWIALLTCLLCTVPSLAFRLSPIISSVAGFTSGFFIPREETGWWYRWLFYINPNFYGFSASAKILLSDINNDCDDDEAPFECYTTSGNYALRQFGFQETKPFMNIAILLLMTVIYLMLAVFSNWARHTNFFLNFKSKLRGKKNFLDTEDESILEEEPIDDDDISDTESISRKDEQSQINVSSEKEKLELQTLRDITVSPYEDDVFEEEQKKPAPEVKQRWLRFAKGSLEKKDEQEQIEINQPVLDSQGRPKRLDFRQKQKRKRVQSIFLDNQEHMVYKPLQSGRQTPTTPAGQFANLVSNIVAQKKIEQMTSPTPTIAAGNSLKERREKFEYSIKTTQEVVKRETEELNKVDEFQREKKTFRDVTRRVTEKLKEEKAPKMAGLVGEVMKMTSSAPTSFDDGEKEESSTTSTARQRANSTTSGVVTLHHMSKRRQRQDSSSNLFVHKVRELTAKTRRQQSLQAFPVAPLKKNSTVASFDLQGRSTKSELKKRSTDMSLPLSSGSYRSSGNSPSPFLEERPSIKSPHCPVYKEGFELDDIKEVNDETEEQESLQAASSQYTSVPDIRIEHSPRKKPGKYRKLSDPGSPPPNESEFVF